jgi:hypothetical protein
MDPGGEEGGRDFMKSLAEQKLRSFSIGTMGTKRVLTKKEQEEMRKKQDRVQFRWHSGTIIKAGTDVMIF